MKRNALLCLSLLLLSGVLTAQAPPAALARPRDLTAVATGFLDLMAKGDFQAATRDFGDSMKGAAPPEKLAEIWTALQSRLGAYKKRLSVRAEKQGPYDIVVATTEFERGTID